MRLILICTAVYAVGATCDLNDLSMPEYADSWSCNKPIENGKVEKYARCKIVCHDGYDFWKGNYKPCSIRSHAIIHNCCLYLIK